MTLIDGDRIVTVQLYNDEYEVFTEKEMSIIDYINAYTDEGVTAADIVEQPSWIPVSERLPVADEDVLVTNGRGMYVGWIDATDKGWRVDSESEYFMNDIVAWMPLPEPYEAESEE